MEDRITREDVLAALAIPGVTQRQLALALGKAEARITEWKNGARPNVSRAQLARAIAKVTRQGGSVTFGPRDPEGADARAYAAGVFVELEADARRLIDRIDEARHHMGLEVSPPSVNPSELAAGTAALPKGSGGPAADAPAPTKRHRHRAAGES
jgi:transcriptional regulator with XRE-family HTH domain